MKEWGEVCWAEGDMWAMVVPGRRSIVGSAWLERGGWVGGQEPEHGELGFYPGIHSLQDVKSGNDMIRSAL